MTDRASANTKSNAMPERYRETFLPTTVECWDEMDEMTKKNSAILVSHIIRIPGSARTHFPRTRRKVTWTMPLSPCLCCHVQLHNSRQPSFRRRLLFSRTQSSLHCHVLFSRSQPSFNPRVLFSCTLSSFYRCVLFSRSQLSFRRMLISRSRSLFRRRVLFSGSQPSFHRHALYSAAANSPANARSSADAGSTTTACSIATTCYLCLWPATLSYTACSFHLVSSPADLPKPLEQAGRLWQQRMHFHGATPGT